MSVSIHKITFTIPLIKKIRNNNSPSHKVDNRAEVKKKTNNELKRVIINILFDNMGEKIIKHL